MRTIIIAEATLFKPNITKRVFDENVKKQIKDSVKLFNLVCKFINLLQSTQASIADAAEEWMNLQLPEGFDECIPYVKKRQKNAFPWPLIP